VWKTKLRRVGLGKRDLRELANELVIPKIKARETWKRRMKQREPEDVDSNIKKKFPTKK